MSAKNLHSTESRTNPDLNQVCPDNHGYDCNSTSPDQRTVERKLEQVNEKIATLHLAVRSAVAEAEYARQRAQADLAHAHKFGIEGLAKALLPFKDALEMALTVKTNDVNSLREGLELSLKQLHAALEKHGVQEICPRPGDPFDAQKHRPLVKLGSEGNLRTVARTEQKGYEVNGRVIRPAFVLLR